MASKHVHLMDGTPCVSKRRYPMENGVTICEEHDRRAVLRTDPRPPKPALES
jgi:hypothetical protein